MSSQNWSFSYSASFLGKRNLCFPWNYAVLALLAIIDTSCGPGVTAPEVQNDNLQTVPPKKITYFANIDFAFSDDAKGVVSGKPTIEIRLHAALSEHDLGGIDVQLFSPLRAIDGRFANVKVLAQARDEHDGVQSLLGIDYNLINLQKSVTKGTYYDGRNGMSQPGVTSTEADSPSDAISFCTSASPSEVHKQSVVGIQRLCWGLVRPYANASITLVALASCGDRGLLLVFPSLNELYQQAGSDKLTFRAGSLPVELTIKGRKERVNVTPGWRYGSSAAQTYSALYYEGEAAASTDACASTCLGGTPLQELLKDNRLEKLPGIVAYMK